MRRLRELFSDILIVSGLAIAVFSVIGVILVLVTAVPVGNPYIGMFTFIFLPTLVIAGGLIFIFGVVISRRKKEAGPVKRGLREWFKQFVIVDFRHPQQRRRLVFFFSVGVVELIALSVGGMRTAEYMDTSDFCGKTCHTVMYPEYTAYQGSPHARVSCVSCHIGPGAPWLVRSKITGTKQLMAVVLDTYPRPVESPVESLRPARETCEVCHWPTKFSGDIIRTTNRYQADENNTKQTTVQAFKVGGGEPEDASGIHWHVSANVWYLPLDEKRQQIGWVGVEGADGKLVEYLDPKGASQVTPERIAKGKRLMDCVDCHNRATHVFRSPEELIDKALSEGKISPSLPNIKKKGLEALSPVGKSLDEAMGKVESVAEYYKTSYPDVYTTKRDSVDRAVEALKNVAKLTVFPEMNVTWQTHTNNLGHTKSPGCFRCHGKLTDSSKKAIVAGCDTCHYSVKL